jgi:hypothetical protein
MLLVQTATIPDFAPGSGENHAWRSADTWIIVMQSEVPLRDVVVCMLSKNGESATAFRLVFETGMRAAASSPSSLIPHCLASSSTGNTVS